MNSELSTDIGSSNYWFSFSLVNEALIKTIKQYNKIMQHLKMLGYILQLNYRYDDIAVNRCKQFTLSPPSLSQTYISVGEI